MMEEIMVSVICITYNQSAYIEEALQSFINQKTNFKYEIIVHDDASTDSTADIVRKYQGNYPDKVRAILQHENQYSKGLSILDKLIEEEVRGKYIAICEGDDFWTDAYKLQKQIDYMETHLGCTLCFHNAREMDMKTGNIKEIWRFNQKIYRGEGSYNSEETIKLACVPAASMVFRSEDMPIPYLYSDKIRLGDMVRTICLGTKGYSYCMKDTMSVYRVGIDNSASDIWKQSMENHNRRYIGTIETLENIERYTNYEWHGIISEMIKEYKKKLLFFAEEDIKKIQMSSSKIFIYGTGKYAEWCSNCMEKSKIEFAGYIVSEDKCRNLVHRGKKVLYLDEIEALGKAGIIIGTSDKYKDEIIRTLENRGIKNYCQGITRSVACK